MQTRSEQWDMAGTGPVLWEEVVRAARELCYQRTCRKGDLGLGKADAAVANSQAAPVASQVVPPTAP